MCPKFTLGHLYDYQGKHASLCKWQHSFIHTTGAEVVSKGVVWGAAKLSELITFGSDSLKDYVPPATQKKEVDPKWQKTASVARDVSGKAVKVSGYLCKFLPFLYFLFIFVIPVSQVHS